MIEVRACALWFPEKSRNFGKDQVSIQWGNGCTIASGTTFTWLNLKEKDDMGYAVLLAVMVIVAVMLAASGGRAQGADLLIHDAEYTDQEYAGPPLVRQGWGHSTWRMAVDVGQHAQVKRLALTHHHAQHSDAVMRAIEREAQVVFPQAFVAREGTTIVL